VCTYPDNSFGGTVDLVAREQASPEIDYLQV
jgi:hypothetical protein